MENRTSCAAGSWPCEFFWQLHLHSLRFLHWRAEQVVDPLAAGLAACQVAEFLAGPLGGRLVIERLRQLGRGGAHVGEAGFFHRLGGLGELFLQGLGFLAVELGLDLVELLGGLVVLALLERLAGPFECLGRGHRLAQGLHLGIDQPDVELGLLGGDGGLHLRELGERLLGVDARQLHLLDGLGQLLDQLLELGVVFLLGGLGELFDALFGVLGGGEHGRRAGRAGLA